MKSRKKGNFEIQEKLRTETKRPLWEHSHCLGERGNKKSLV